MRQLLVVNPNTSQAVTALLQHHVQSAVGASAHVQVVTARFGAPYIANEASYAVAAHATLDAWEAARDIRPDAVLIGCFGDPGLWALREVCGVPVRGLAEASFAEAARHGRYAIVTGGEKWRPILWRLALSLGQTRTLAAIHTVQATGAQLAADPEAAHAALRASCEEVLRAHDVQAIVIGGAGLAGMADTLQPHVAVPLIDSVQAGVRACLLPAADQGLP